MATQYPPRRARKGARITFADTDGTLHTMRVDSKGILRPKTAEEHAAADRRGLAIARSEQKSIPKKKAPARRSSASRESRRTVPAASTSSESTSEAPETDEQPQGGEE